MPDGWRCTTTPASTSASTTRSRSDPAGRSKIAHSSGQSTHRISQLVTPSANVRGNAGAFNNGMPMTASLGCGTWGGNITSENISVKHYMNTTWVSRVIPEDKPSEQELLGEFYGSEIF